jgi:hypothetical protein
MATQGFEEIHWQEIDEQWKVCKGRSGRRVALVESRQWNPA